MPRQVIEPRKGAKRYVRRGKQGTFTAKQVGVGRSLVRTAAPRQSEL